MCRWLAYSGPPIYLDRLVFKPQNSLISQSLQARESVATTNGDGFGIGWFNEKPEPGVYRETQPAWNDENLRHLTAQIRSHHFFAHVRASTGTATSRVNSHPFRHGPWLFMHNGQIGGFEGIRRSLCFQIDPALFPYLRGSTDSEVFFLLFLTLGGERDPAAGFARTVEAVQAIMAQAGIDEPLRITAALSDGQSIHALRYASDGKAPSLYYGCGVHLDDGDDSTTDGTGNSVLILSEPLDQDRAQWQEVPQSHLLIAGDGAVSLSPFAPAD